MPRKKPFSNKQKKKQLQEKRQKKREQSHDEEPGVQTRLSVELPLDDGSNLSADVSEDDGDSVASDADDEETSTPDITKLNYQPFKQGWDKKFDPNRYRLHFERETKAEIEARKKKSREPIQATSEADLEVSLERIYQPGSVLDVPKRPPWNYKMSKEDVEANERKMFHKYLADIYKAHRTSELSYFEHNLETWRQLWRVLEVSDIVVLIADIRHPVLHFSPAVYDYVVKDLQKDIILVLNKIDLVSPEFVVAWKHYFLSKFPSLNVVCFTSFPKDENERKGEQKKVLSQRRRKKKGFFAVGPKELLSASRKICGERVDLTSWERKIVEQEKGEDDGVVYDEYGFSEESEVEDEREFEDVEPNESILTIGLVGHPNVGKSSVLNGLMGKKVVSTSRTPGHTKHFQTIFLTNSVRLCDSPGLVFPSLVDKQLQILSGMYPIAQVQEPYTAVGYLASRVAVSLVNVLELVPPRCNTDTEGEEEHDHSTYVWSAWDICDAWAEKRGYYTAKTGRPDTYRAANSILRLAVDGRIVLCVYPPDFTSGRGKWLKHSDTALIAEQQEKHTLCRRLRHSEGNDGNSDEEVASHLMMHKYKRKTRDSKGRKMSADVASSEGDDEAEESEAVVTSNNPYVILSDD